LKMKMNTKRARIGIAASAITALCVMAAPAAQADTIELNGWWGGNGSANITLLAGGVNYNDGSVLASNLNESGGAGGFKTYDTTLDPAKNNSFESWCVDIFHNFSFVSSAPATLQSASTFFGSTLGASAGSRIADDLGRLATNHLADVTTTVNNSTTAEKAVAFQLAVWEIVNENAGFYGLGAGNFKVNSATGSSITMANTWLGELASTTSAYNVSIWGVSNGASGSGQQDVAIFAPVPEPEIYAMMGIGLGLMGWVARRRRQTAV
jgi:hypothetical protein